MSRSKPSLGVARLVLGVGALITLGLTPARVGAQTALRVPLNGIAFDMEQDVPRRRLYVSVPRNDEIVVISTATWQVVNRIRIDGAPHGISISIDGSRLLVALNEAGALAFVDLQTFEQTRVDIREQLGRGAAWDVIEGKPGRVFAVGDTLRLPFDEEAWIVMVKTDEGNVASRVVSSGFGWTPKLMRSPDPRFFYLASVNFVAKLDISTDEPWLVDTIGTTTYPDRTTISPDGEWIYEGNGSAIRTEDFQRGDGFIAFNEIARVKLDGSRVYMGSSYFVNVYDSSSHSLLGRVNLPCLLGDVRGFELLEDGAGLVVAGDKELCGISTASFPPASCRLAPAYADGVLNLNFDLRTPTPAAWNLWVSAGGSTAKVWQYSLPVVSTEVPVRVPIQGVPPVGRIGFWTTLTTTQGILCSDFELVDTGRAATAVSAQGLRSAIARGRAQ